MLTNTQPTPTGDAAPAATPVTPAAPVVEAKPAEAAAAVPAPEPTPEAGRKEKLEESAHKRARDLAAENAELAKTLEAERADREKMVKRLESLEKSAADAAAKEAADKRKAAFDRHLDAAKIKPKFRAHALAELGEIDPAEPTSAKKVDELAAKFPEWVDVAPFPAPRSPWQTEPGAQPKNPNQRPSGRDFMPQSRIPRS